MLCVRRYREILQEITHPHTLATRTHMHLGIYVRLRIKKESGKVSKNTYTEHFVLEREMFFSLSSPFPFLTPCTQLARSRFSFDPYYQCQRAYSAIRNNMNYIASSQKSHPKSEIMCDVRLKSACIRSNWDEIDTFTHGTISMDTSCARMYSNATQKSGVQHIKHCILILNWFFCVLFERLPRIAC